MHEMQTIVTDVCGVRLSVCSEGGGFNAAFTKVIWPLV